MFGYYRIPLFQNNIFTQKVNRFDKLPIEPITVPFTRNIYTKRFDHLPKPKFVHGAWREKAKRMGMDRSPLDLEKGEVWCTDEEADVMWEEIYKFVHVDVEGLLKLYDSDKFDLNDYRFAITNLHRLNHLHKAFQDDVVPPEIRGPAEPEIGPRYIGMSDEIRDTIITIDEMTPEQRNNPELIIQANSTIKQTLASHSENDVSFVDSMLGRYVEMRDTVMKVKKCIEINPETGLRDLVEHLDLPIPDLSWKPKEKRAHLDFAKKMSLKDRRRNARNAFKKKMGDQRWLRECAAREKREKEEQARKEQRWGKRES
eukprot:TRINITY_DN3093_c0_g1_i4.p1 TRINITY_DN3093_c0_g1~~TRINITY_DN3093_c0_g1_i4.p1  ORF type:complete len:314 (-),score=87.71 TRINITY_DN3093_c0_g1_i4:17-958(-)